MKHTQLDLTQGFAVAFGNERAQAAVMVVQPDETVGGPDNRHGGSDQWLYVVAGQGSATVGGRDCELRPGVLVLIERGEAHEIRNSGDVVLQTLNFYTPPAYSAAGETLPPGEG